MLDPYRMVFVNILFSFIILCSIYAYKRIYPLKKINFFLLLTCISILPVISIFRSGAYESGDFTIHIYRAIAFYNSLLDGHIIPSWAAELNAAYGYPLFIFNYPLPYYILSLFHALGFSFITSMKLFLAVSFILSGIGMYFLGKQLFNNSFNSFVSAVIYLFTPYHLVALHFKNTIGEILSFTLLPFFFYFLHKLFIHKKISYLLVSAVFFAFLIMSHVVIALFAIVIAGGFSLLYSNKKNSKKILISFFLASIVGGALSAFVWLPPFFLSQYTFLSLVSIGFVHFPTISELLYSPWRLGFLFQGPKGEISHLLGYTQIVLLCYSLFLIIKKTLPKNNKVKVLFWSFTTIVLVFLILPYAKPLWGIFPFLKVVGSHRLLILFSFSIAIVGGYIALQYKENNKMLHAFIFLTIFSTILNWGHRRMIPDITDTYLIQRLWKSTSESEAHFYANTRWVDIKNPWFSERPNNPLIILSGTGEIKQVERTSTEHVYIVSAQTPLYMQENTLYFPGWTVSSNNKNVPITPNNKGIITLKIPSGLQLIKVTYKDHQFYEKLKQLSILGFSSIILYYLFLFKNSYPRRKTQ